MSLEEIYGKIGTEEELIEIVNYYKRIDSIEYSKKILVIRAIRQEELKQLIQNGPNHFLFHKGVRFLSSYDGHVKTYADARNGTIVFTQINKEHSLGRLPHKGEIHNKKITRGGHGEFLIDFYSQVKVYNDKGFDWEYLEKNKDILWDCCDDM